MTMKKDYRLSACAIGVVLSTIALSTLAVTSAEAAGSAHVAPSAQHSINYFWNDTCQLVTRSQAEAVLHVPLTVGVFVKPGGQCAYRALTPAGAQHDKNLDLVIYHGAAPSAHSVVIGTVVAEPSLGKGAWCSSAGISATLDANFTVRLNGKPIYLSIATATCTDAVKFAKLAFTQVS